MNRQFTLLTRLAVLGIMVGLLGLSCSAVTRRLSPPTRTPAALPTQTAAPANQNPSQAVATETVDTEAAGTETAGTQPADAVPVDEGPVLTGTPGTVSTAVTIYLVALDDHGKTGLPVGCGDSLVGVNRTALPVESPVEDAIRAGLGQLFSIRDQFIGESGLYNAIYQSNLQVERIAVESNGAVTVAITGQVQLGGVCDTPRFKGQIEQTILSVPGVRSANITLNGQPIDQALSEK